MLFIDEIQESPEAIQMLRYFYEEFPDLHVIAAGSLLEFAMKKVKSFPVGRVEYLYLHPLNFIEYLGARQPERQYMYILPTFYWLWELGVEKLIPALENSSEKYY